MDTKHCDDRDLKGNIELDVVALVETSAMQTGQRVNGETVAASEAQFYPMGRSPTANGLAETALPNSGPQAENTGKIPIHAGLGAVCQPAGGLRSNPGPVDKSGVIINAVEEDSSPVSATESATRRGFLLTARVSGTIPTNGDRVSL